MSSSEFISVSIFCVNKLLRQLKGYILFCCVLFLAGCQGQLDPSALNSLAKSDIDNLADISINEMHRLMEELSLELYRSHQSELNKGLAMTVAQRRSQLFENRGRLIFKELQRKQGTDALDLAFDPEFEGDRVFAVMAGLLGVVRSSYHWKTEQFLFDSLDQQALFNSARNIEVLALRLRQAKGDDGTFLFPGIQVEGQISELERLFGKLIAIQDMMAFAIAGKYERGVSSVIRQALFLPMGL